MTLAKNLDTGDQQRHKWKNIRLQPLESKGVHRRRLRSKVPDISFQQGIEIQWYEGAEKAKDASVKVVLDKAMEAEAEPALRKRPSYK